MVWWPVWCYLDPAININHHKGGVMNRSIVAVSVSLLLIAGRSVAQETTTPLFNPNNTVRLQQTEKSLVIALESDSPGLQATAAQTVRELKVLLPDESFSAFVIPLMRIVKNGDAQVEARILAALALQDLHSHRGDFVIKMEAKYTGNGRLAHIFGALAMERVKEVQSARYAGTKEANPDVVVAR